ncbi:MAG: DUF4912 domain-containing protein [Acidobacteriota bacterium]
MSENKIPADNAESGSDVIEFVPDEIKGLSSGSMLSGSSPAVKNEKPVEQKFEVPVAADIEIERSAAFKELAEPKLPRLERENRARLSMQTPNRLFFYWSTAANPLKTLERALHNRASNYSLVLKLTDLKRRTEEIHPIEEEGSFWFEVEADGEYRAEIGFYSPSRPYIRIMYSNTVQTPRKSPSPHTADEAEWRVSADRFAKVLNVAGFKQDAFDVALSGDDSAAADNVTRRAFTGLIGSEANAADDVLGDEIRYALLALAAGAALESLRFRVGARLFALMQANFAKLSAENALSTVRDNFGVEADEMLEEETLSAVYGSSRVNFPRTLRRRRGFAEKFETISSHSFNL